ncbi:MAG: LPS export ABC transporter permease LptG [Candidatus Desulfofervidus auxilii]|nr:LPS export ABC transporter permease LptG [Candidatus Desulfofervidus auxilii]
MIKLIDKYLAKQFIKILILLLVSFVIIYLVFDFLEKIDNFSEAGIDTKTIITYFILSIPGILSQLFPTACLLSTLFSLSLAKKHNELIAWQACGISPYRIGAFYILFGIIFSISLFLYNEFIVCKTQAITNYIWNIKVKKRKTKGGYFQQGIWLKGENAIYQIDAINLKTNTLYGVTIYFFTPNFQLKKRLDASKVTWNSQKNIWVFYQGVEQVIFKGKIKMIPFIKKNINLKETPKDFQFLKANYQQLDFWQLKNYVKKLKKQGYNVSSYATDLWQRTSIPFTPLILIIFGMALVFKGKETKTAALIGLGILIAFIFWVIQAFSIALGKSGYIYPFLAAWFPNLLFGVWGIILLKYSSE